MTEAEKAMIIIIRKETEWPYHLIADAIHNCVLDKSKLINYMREQEEKKYFMKYKE